MSPFSLRTAPASARIAITAFLLLAMAGLGIAALQVRTKAGMTAEGALRHYRGDEATMQYPKSFAEMVEITHAHAFSLPMLALVLGLGLAQCAVRERIKVLVNLALFLGVALELGVPWLVRYGPVWTVHLLPATGALLGGGILVAAAVPLYEMWGPRRRS